MVRTWRSLEDPDLVANRQTASLAALAVTLGLIVAGLYLIETLRGQAALQDCLLSGHPYCTALVLK